jgi:hypothetical protein
VKYNYNLSLLISSFFKFSFTSIVKHQRKQLCPRHHLTLQLTIQAYEDQRLSPKYTPLSQPTTQYLYHQMVAIIQCWFTLSKFLCDSFNLFQCSKTFIQNAIFKLISANNLGYYFWYVFGSFWDWEEMWYIFIVKNLILINFFTVKGIGYDVIRWISATKNKGKALTVKKLSKMRFFTYYKG